jgi:two-component system, NtrC family, sensor histidine kinase HydH
MVNPQQKILVIDDESVSRAIISRMLDKLGFAVTAAADGATGLEAYRRHTPDLVMVDLFMPGVDGFQVLEAIQGQSPEKPVIVLSATDRIDDVIKALRLGAWDFINKPVKDSVFLENAVFRALEKAALIVENRLFRERIEAIFENVPCGIIVVESAGQTILDANPMAARMVGRPAAEMLGKKCSGFIYPDQPDAGVAADPESTCVRSEHILLKSDGTRIPVHKTVTRAIIENRACAIESFVDISEHKKTQAVLLERNKMRGVLEMAGAICHEMNQPLQVVSGFCELIRMDLDETSPIYGKFTTIRDQVAEMGRITAKLMGITRYRTKEYLENRIIDIDEASSREQS